MGHRAGDGTGQARRSVSRRDVLGTALGAAGAMLVPAQAGQGTGPMTYEGVIAQAQRLADAPYTPRPDDLPAPLRALTYDGYRAIAFRPEAAPRLGRFFSAQMFHRGFLHGKRVALFLQPKSGPPQPIAYRPGLFDLGGALAGQDFSPELGFAGFRLHYAFDRGRPEAQEEFFVFLGASYFRLRGRDQEYGLSARGAAIGTGLPQPEEFPDFTAFWICEPDSEGGAVTIFALLDSPSLAGAYRFVVEPGDPSRLSVAATLHPRKTIERLGLAPLTSMFLHGQNGPGARGAQALDDFRPQVHDSDGLVVAKPGDRLWRPLLNGRAVAQVSSFEVDPLEGFGLLQRERDFAAYLDVEARQEARPGLWVAPGRGFGAGAVQLYEIPSREEYADNIVAAFVARAPLRAGSPLALDYTLTTVGREPDASLPGHLARVVSTRIGSPDTLRPVSPPIPGRRLFVVDFEGPALPADGAGLAPEVSASAGTLVDPVLERVRQTGGWRLYVEWRPPAAMPPGDVILRARLMQEGRAVSETWDAAA
jgi:glucans biosynthesis protein